MAKQKIFISSVQAEFASERKMLYDYICTDALLGRFFEPFIFEKLPAKNVRADEAYLEQVKQSDIYLGIFGLQYGFEDGKGVSPTEHEFNLALKENKTKLVFICDDPSHKRHPKEEKLIKKAEQEVVRKKFFSASDLKTAVYAALISYLEEKEFIRTVPFDASICKGATIADLDVEKIKWFVETARSKRNLPIALNAKPKTVLTHLNLLKEQGLTNAAILLFGKNPQRFFITAEIRCVLFHGNEVSKPIPAYQVYKGDVFEQVNNAVDFVLSRINLSVGDRSHSVEATVEYEIPRTAIAEAIVNAVAHRDYTSTGSVQVMLFRNRLEVWNPGHLPSYLSIAKLKKPHASFPPNPLLAEPLYLAGFIERLGTGIPDMIHSCVAAGLRAPELVQEEEFRVTLWRKIAKTDPVADQLTDQVKEQVGEQVSPQVTMQDTMQDAMQVTMQVKQLVSVLDGVVSRDLLQEKTNIQNRDYFRMAYINKALEFELIEMTIPDKPTSKNQKYRLTAKGKALKEILKKEK